MSQQVVTSSPPASRRGRESTGDMVRSLGLVLIFVVALWFLAQPPGSDSKTIRVVDPTSDIAALRAAAPGIPAPGPLPGWRATSSTLDPAGLRIGWVTPDRHYAEYAAAVGAQPDFLPDLSGRGTEVEPVQVGAVSWRQLRDSSDHRTLFRQVGAYTVVVGGVREDATAEELGTLAASVG